MVGEAVPLFGVMRIHFLLYILCAEYCERPHFRRPVVYLEKSSEEESMDIASLLENQTKKWPGIVQVASLIAALVALLANRDEKEFTLLQSLAVLVVALVLYKAGTYLDPMIFDPLYGLKPSYPIRRAWRPIARAIFFPVRLVADQLPGTVQMTVDRKVAATTIRSRISGSSFICSDDEDCAGIYNTAKGLLENSEAWDDHVKPWLERSKVARSFVFPLTALLLYDLIPHGWRIAWLDHVLNAPILRWVSDWLACLGVILLAVILYVWLRAFHMRAMYRLVINSEYIPLAISQTTHGEHRTAVRTRHLGIGEADRRKSELVFLLISA
jgi:hypothetical protein